MRSFVALKLPLAVLAVFALVLTPASTALAHVTVKPGEVATAQYQVFTVNVPNEKSLPTVAVQVVMPENITNVTPTSKAGWEVEIDKEAADENVVVKSITWSDGEITDGLRDEFSFSAKTPDSATELHWKAYQTYSDGSIVAWDQAESKDGHGHGDSGPFSITNVTEAVESETQATTDRGLYLGWIGIATGLVAIFIATRKK